MTVEFLIRWSKRWRLIAASIPRNDKRFDRAIKNLMWLYCELSQIEATIRKIRKKEWTYFK